MSHAYRLVLVKKVSEETTVQRSRVVSESEKTQQTLTANSMLKIHGMLIVEQCQIITWRIHEK